MLIFPLVLNSCSCEKQLESRIMLGINYFGIVDYIGEEFF
jgi:hypothetical protein